MKASGSYASLVRGVSQQVPQNRAPGQATEQVNFTPDPVRGLSRRHGSLLAAETKLTALSAALMAEYTQDTANWRTFSYHALAREFVVLHRTQARPVGSDLPLMLVYDRTNNSWMTTVRPPVDAELDKLESGGISAITNVGRYLFMAGHTTDTAATTTEVWDADPNRGQATLWVRGGAYSRIYNVIATRTDGVTFTFSYATPPSSYQGTLTTADIPASDPEYAKKVNDRVNAYNSAVTAWIGTASAAIQPDAIAQQLANAAVAAGLPYNQLKGSTIGWNNVKALQVTDGGDGSLLRGVAQEVDSAERVSSIHYVGKTVRIRSANASESFYLKAVAADSALTSGFTEVVWEETAGQVTTIDSALLYATAEGNTMYMASSATLLATILPGDHPDYQPSTCGDVDSNAIPYFIGEKITYLGVFQDRLLVGAGAVLRTSKVGDYLNFFATSILTVPDDDPLEMQSQGADDDVLRHSVLYDRDLIIFGDKRQYVVQGRNALTPTGVTLPVLSSHAGSADVPPIPAGGLIFYSKVTSSNSSLYQIEPGRISESPEAYDVSTQLDNYVMGSAIELALSSKPSALFVRTTANRHGVFVFSYLDQSDGRRQDAWHRWQFNEDLGPIIGMTAIPDGILIFTLRVDNGAVWLVADLVPLTTGLSLYPYLDSLRPWAAVQAGTGSVRTSSTGDIAVAFDASSEYRYIGEPLANAATLFADFPSAPGAEVGFRMESSYTPTNPFMRDRNDVAITTGRLTITKKVLSFEDSSGFTWDVVTADRTDTYEFNGYLLGVPGSDIGRTPVTTGQAGLAIGREARGYTLVIRSRDWFPLSITGMEWIGQFFNRTARV